MFIEDLTQFFLNKMNNNSESVLFRAGYLMQRANTEFEFKTYANYYTEVNNKYTPAMFNFIGTPQNVPNRDITEFTVILELILTGEKETDPELVKEINALEEFRIGLVNNPTDTLNGYKVIMSANPITRAGEIRIRGSKPRIAVSMEITLQTGIGLLSGNENLYTLALSGETPVNVFPVQSSTIMGITETTDSDLTASGSSTSSVGQDKTVRYDLTFIDDGSEILNKIKEILTGFNKNTNTKFDLSITYQSFVLNEKVIVSGGTYVANANNITTINCQLLRTDG